VILGKDELEDIAQRIDFIQIQLGDLLQFNNLDWPTYGKDRNVQRNIERLIENVANATIDICKIILAGEEIEMPNSYKEIIIKLGLIDILEKDLAEKIADYAALRNFLAHQYLELKWDKIKKFIKEAPRDYKDFISAIVRHNLRNRMP
jgi:uncharacterized protein YutE (UPF0331/DUF86 family)